MARPLLTATLLLLAAPPAWGETPPEGTAPAPKRRWDYRTDREIRSGSHG